MLPAASYRGGKQLLGACAPTLRGVLNSVLVCCRIQPPKILHDAQELHTAAALPSLCCVPLARAVCLPVRGSFLLFHTRCTLSRFTCAAMSPVSSYVSLEYSSHFAPSSHILKIAKNGFSIRGQICPGLSLPATSSFSFRSIVRTNERLFIAGTKCSDMPGMSKRYYAPLKGPLFRDKNDNFMPLQWNHKYHF